MSAFTAAVAVSWSGEQQAGHQVGGDGGEVEQLGHPGHEQAAHQGKGQLNQDFHRDTSVFIEKRAHISPTGPHVF